ncbi:uncharacterized protein [Nicotiana tomentosiformis]|uniref:uncharacterized protein n=1 Tax=Nicotiana tomentosiformis TaxID=4098 RepID=UPI00388C4048
MRVDLLLLDMVELKIILGIGWLSLYHAILDCYTKTVMLAMPGLPRLQWRGVLGHIHSREISFLKARRMVEKGYLVYLDFVRDVSADTPTIDSVPAVKKISDVFPADLSGMPPDRDIDLVPETQHISILWYHMAPTELKELKE